MVYPAVWFQLLFCLKAATELTVFKNTFFLSARTEEAASIKPKRSIYILLHAALRWILEDSRYLNLNHYFTHVYEFSPLWVVPTRDHAGGEYFASQSILLEILPTTFLSRLWPTEQVDLSVHTDVGRFLYENSQCFTSKIFTIPATNTNLLRVVSYWGSRLWPTLHVGKSEKDDDVEFLSRNVPSKFRGLNERE